MTLNIKLVTKSASFLFSSFSSSICSRTVTADGRASKPFLRLGAFLGLPFRLAGPDVLSGELHYLDLLQKRTPSRQFQPK